MNLQSIFAAGGHAFAICELKCLAPMSMPLLLGPCGFIRMVHPNGEVGSARAAGKAGVPYILSTMSGYRLEEVAQATSGPRWYQLYLVGGREVAEGTLERIRKAGYSGLVITIDTGAAGNRERDIRNGSRELMSGNKFASIPFLPQLLSHPSWLMSFLLDGGRLTLPNVVVPGRGPMPLADAPAALLRSVVAWEDLRWLRDSSGRPNYRQGSDDRGRCASRRGRRRRRHHRVEPRRPPARLRPGVASRAASDLQAVASVPRC